MKLRLFLITLVISIFLANITKAQTDSTHYDLGRLEVNKNFTQSITVKASDIERYQFNYITDALSVFFYGTFTNSSSVVYVIDGNIVNDVNAYNIQDVEEITLVQSALGQVNGASPAQQLILIKTRRGGPGKQGITASNQTSFVDARNNNNYPNANKPTGLYEQLYLGGYKNYANADFGISANYMHNISPEDLPATYTAFNPFHYDQFRFNGYADAKLWKGTTLSFDANYTPETANVSFTGNSSTPNNQLLFAGTSHESQHLLNTDIRLRSHIAGGLTNTISAGYNHYNDFEKGVSDQSVNGQYYQSATTSLQAWQQHGHTVLLKDNLTYHQQAGDWSIDPSLNFMYRHVSDSLSLHELVYQDTIPNNVYTSAGFQSAHYSLSLLTPSIDIYYKNIFDIQGGFTAILNKENLGPIFPVNHLSPFVSTSVNISEMAALQAVKLKVFASFSRQNTFLDDPYVSLATFTLQGFDNATGTYTTNSTPFLPSEFNLFQSYNNYQAGLILGLGKHFSVSYNFRENYYGIIAEYEVPSGANSVSLADVNQKAKAVTNSIALNYDLQSGNFGWRSALIATTSKLQLTDQPGSQANNYLNTGHRWTGGFTNRFTYKTLFAGLDILYQVGERPYSLQNWLSIYPTYVPSSNRNSFTMQSLYLGTRLKINSWKYAEVYINTRNMLQNKSSDITDERRFYGFGFKVNW
ncbi:MAG: hypothetical protein JSU01_01705 [Bacteroidetes bacterium]|nr:hypothetical protein [Bacteroidota bacterium]